MTRLPNELIDRPDRAASLAPADLIKDVLASVRLSGALFLRAEYTSPWAYESPPSTDLTRILRPGAKRLILFHIIAEGDCWIRNWRTMVGGDAPDPDCR
jgi:Cupin